MHTPLIAIVDDDDAFLELMADLLGDAGYRAVCCATARDGGVILRRIRPALIILDLWLRRAMRAGTSSTSYAAIPAP